MKHSAQSKIVWLVAGVLIAMQPFTATAQTNKKPTNPKTPATKKAPQAESGSDALVKAAGNGDLAIVKKLTPKGVKIDQAGKQGVNALMMACLKKQTEVAKYLLDNGASPSASAPVGEGEDTGATTFGYIALCKDERTTRAATPLFLASLAGATDIVQMLLDKGAPVDAATANGATPLYIACQMGNKEVTKLLLTAKAKSDIATKYGWTPLFAAAWKGDVDSTQLLLDAGADANATGTMLMMPAKISGTNDMGMKKVEKITALYIAAMAGKADIVKLLLSKGASVAAKTSAGETATDAAAFVKKDDIVQMLRQAGTAK